MYVDANLSVGLDGSKKDKINVFLLAEIFACKNKQNEIVSFFFWLIWKNLGLN